MFNRINAEYFFDRCLRYMLIEDKLFNEAEREVSSVGMNELLKQARYVGRRADIYWAAYCGRCVPKDPPRKIYHHPPRFVI